MQTAGAKGSDGGLDKGREVAGEAAEETKGILVGDDLVGNGERSRTFGDEGRKRKRHEKDRGR